jgi:hypothetical protein
MQQYNSRNWPAYLCNISCCHLWNTLLVKLLALRDDGATAGNILNTSQ